MSTREQPNGRVEVAESRPLESAPAASGIQLTRHVWHPPAAAAEHLPRGFTLKFEAISGRDGVRRFTPVGGAQAINLAGSLGGYALLSAREGLGAEQRFAYHAMRLLYQLGHLFREYLARRFDRLSDLYSSGQSDPGGRHVLPEGLGLDARGEGEPWTPAVLVSRGREVGGNAATASECIRLGLIEAARRDPFDPAGLTEAGGAALVRMALFDFSPGDPPAADKVAAVRERLLAALERHGKRDTRRDFWKWLFKDLNNIAHGIWKRKTGGVRLARQEVRHALLDLVFEAYTYQGDCVHVQMQAFAAALPEPLSDAERPLFDALYAKQTYLGGLPFVMLAGRFDWLKAAAQDHWEDPTDAAKLGVVLRLLDYYGAIVRRKRSSDAAAKAATKAPRGAAQAPAALLETVCDAEGEPIDLFRPDEAPDPFQQAAAELRECRGATCPCESTTKWRATLTADDPLQDPLKFIDMCEVCDHAYEVEITRAEFLAALSAVS